MAGLRLAQVLRWRRVRRDGGMFWTLVLAAAVAGSHSAGIDFLSNGNSTRNDPESWMAQLRRQLMQDNYDYEPSSDEPGLLPGLLDEEAEPPALRGGDQNEIEDEPTTVDSLNAPTFRNYPDDPEPPSEMNQNTRRQQSRLSALANMSRGARRHGVSQQDLLNYVDDAWVHRDNDDNDDDDARRADRDKNDDNDDDDARRADRDKNDDNDDDDDRRAERDNNELSSGGSDLSDGRRAFETTTTTKIYKFLKLPGSARRDGLAPRFVEERSAQGVALLSLDGAPFPPFRLPRERRQYQEMELD